MFYLTWFLSYLRSVTLIHESDRIKCWIDVIMRDKILVEFINKSYIYVYVWLRFDTRYFPLLTHFSSQSSLLLSSSLSSLFLFSTNIYIDVYFFLFFFFISIVSFFFSDDSRGIHEGNKKPTKGKTHVVVSTIQEKDLLKTFFIFNSWNSWLECHFHVYSAQSEFYMHTQWKKRRKKNKKNNEKFNTTVEMLKKKKTW